MSTIPESERCVFGPPGHNMSRHCSIHGGMLDYMAAEVWCDWSPAAKRGDRMVTIGDTTRRIRGNDEPITERTSDEP